MNDRTETSITFADTLTSSHWKMIDNEKKRRRLDLFSSEKTGECVWMEKWESGYESDEWIVHSDGSSNENNQHECTEGY